MTHPEIPGTDLIRPVMPFGSTGSKWVALLVDVLGRLQVDANIDNLPSDLATQTTLNALLTELKLKADLTETQPVSLASLPTGAATIADGSDVALGALADALVAAGAVGSVSGKLRRLTTDLDALLTELKLKADLTETQPVESKDGDKIFGFEGVLADITTGTVAGASGFLESHDVPANKIWVVTNILARTTNRAITRMFFVVVHDGTEVDLYSEVAAIPAGKRENWAGTLYLDVDDLIRVYFTGAADGDAAEIHLIGHVMNAP